MSLAEKGDNLVIDVSTKDIFAEGDSDVDKKDDDNEFFHKMENFLARPVFLWGKAAGRKLCK